MLMQTSDTADDLTGNQHTRLTVTALVIKNIAQRCALVIATDKHLSIAGTYNAPDVQEMLI